MARLTLPHYGGDGHYMKCSESFGCDGNCGECEELDKIVDRLAYYEDMEEQGRLVVLPCKVGDTVYQWGWKHSECHLGVTPPYRPYSECEGCCANECDSVRTTWLYSGKVSAIRIDKDGALVQIAWDDKWDTSWHEIGKTVFLTREEAEQALKGGAENGDRPN